MHPMPLPGQLSHEGMEEEPCPSPYDIFACKGLAQHTAKPFQGTDQYRASPQTIDVAQK